MPTKIWVAAGLVCTAIALYAFQSMPRCATIEPDTAKVGDAVSVKGENLDKKSTGQVFLTNGTKDTKVTIDEQTATEINFKVPQIKPGRYHIAILTANGASIIDQPVVLTVE